MRWFDIKNKNYWRVNGKRDFTIQEVSQLTGISVRSLRNYLRTYPEVLHPKRGYYNSLLFSDKDINIFIMIKTLIKDGFKNSEIIGKINDELALMEPSVLMPKACNSDLPSQSQDISQASDTMIRINPKMLQSVNRFLLAQESKNSRLEIRLERMERLLDKLVERKKSGMLDHFQRIIHSTQELWTTLKKGVT